MATTNGSTNGRGWGGRRSGAGRPPGARSKPKLEREAKLAKAAREGIGPVEFLLSEMRDLSLPREQRQLLAKWVAPYVSPKLSNPAFPR